MISKQLSHTGTVAGAFRTGGRCGDLGIALSGWMRDGVAVYTCAPIFAGIGGGSVPRRWRLIT
jgi:hypothetical protein